MKTAKGLLILMAGLSFTRVVDGQFVSNHNAIFQGSVSQPAKGALINDPNFGTPVSRLTDARTEGIHGLFPDYSKRQAWNSDESRMLLRSGPGEAYLFYGLNYQFIKVLNGVGGEDVFWHPTDPDLVYFNPDSVLYTYNIVTDEVEQIHAFEAYAFANSQGEGNISNNGRYYAVVGQDYNYSTGDVTCEDLLVYDIQQDLVISTLPLPTGQLADFDWVSISPLGNYVVVDYADVTTGRYHGVEVYDRNFNFIWQKGLGWGHSDLGIDASGNEVLIMDIYDDDNNLSVINKYDLATGAITQLLTVSPWFDMHLSCRAMARPGWVYVSTFDYFGRLTDDEAGWLPFEDEVFALKMDGSGTVERYAHHWSRRYSPAHPDSDNSVYFAEPHATVSRSGNRILFGSNWRNQIGEDSSLDAYLVDLSAFRTPHTSLDVRVLLEGARTASPGLMNTALNPVIPLSQPFNTPPWNYGGTETATSVPAGVVDWVLVDLRDAASASAALPGTRLTGWPRAFFLKSNGSVISPDGTPLPDIGNPAVTGNLYVVIYQRNHLSVMSSSGAQLNGGNYSYDFTLGLAQAYGEANGYKLMGTDAMMAAGDIDQDGNIFVSDYNGWATGFGSANGYFRGDLDMDRNVFVSDYNQWATNFGLVSGASPTLVFQFLEMIIPITLKGRGR